MGLVLQEGEGERRVRRNAGKGPFILKVDRQNGGSPDLVMGYEDLAPGAEIQPHTHLVADEILFIHRGSGVANLNGRVSPVRAAGATIYIPRGVQVSVRNTGNEPPRCCVHVLKAGFRELMRDNSVPEGQPVIPMTAEGARAGPQATQLAYCLTTDAGVRDNAAANPIAVPSTPLVLAVDEGERRIRRAQAIGLSSPFILKVDGRNGGSSDLVMGYEDIPPGKPIAAHRHEIADELIFVHRGSGVVELGERVVAFNSGATIYIPRHVRIAVRNTGTAPLSIAFVFSKPGF